MKTLALLAATLGLAGCYYDRPNPWDTSDDVEEYEEKIHGDLHLAMLEVWPNPQVAPDPLMDAELDAWRRTVLPTIEAVTLRHAETKSRDKIAFLEGQIRSLMRTDEHSRKEVLTPVVWRWRIEKERLKLLEDRLARG
ncbi:MAG TPA: hypothetical protein VF950_15340 [Planctomycetota bacterium]